jgi:hypothetical protein
MTPKEHKLLIWLLARQLQNTKTLIKILESRGILENDDAEAFASSVFLDEESNRDVLAQAKEEYLKIAKLLGLETGLEPSR